LHTMTPPDQPPANTLPVAVVIPHLDRLDDTAACCRSLAAQTRPPRLIVVVDNGSPAHGAEKLAAACPNARVLRLETNRGFAGGVNAGLREALGQPELAFFWILNNDTVCPPETLARLVAAAEADGRIGLVGSPLLEGAPESTRRLVPAGRRLAGPWALPRPARPGGTPDYLTGASLLILRETLEDIGLFDEGFFFFFEDADFSRRAVARGWRLAVAPEAAIEHRGSATIRRLGELQACCYRAGHVRYLRKHALHPMAAALPPFLFRLAADALRLRFRALRGNLRGWREGWRTPLN
jgi:GT2 family glycosyltransferase